MRPAKAENVPVFDYAKRRAKVGDRMQQAGIDLLFLPISGDLEYLTGIPRREPSFGNVAYRHGWVAGAFLRPGADPVVVLPRMITEFELPGGAAGDVVIVHETDDGDAVLVRVAAGLGLVRSLAVGARTWAETLIHLRQALSDPAIYNADDLINPLRRIKSSDEMERMAAAARIVDEVMAVVGPPGVPGVTAGELPAEGDLAKSRGQPPGHRGGRVCEVVAPPDGARHRSRCARVPVHLGGRPDAARAGDDIYDRTVCLLAGPRRRPHRGHRRLRGERGPQTESLPGNARGQRLAESRQDPLTAQPAPR